LGSDKIGQSIHAFHASQLFLGWSAFDILAEELLTESVKAYGKLFPPALIGKEFPRGITGIRGIYGKAFAHEGENIISVLADSRLDYILAIRNVLLHKNGKVDKKYLAAVEGKKIELMEIIRPALGEKFPPLKGAFTAILCDYTVLLGNRLLWEVKTWINNKSLMSA
jgi:hypothetical protein